MFQIRPRADVHVQAGDAQPVPIGGLQALAELRVPDAVLRLFAASVGLLAVPVAEAGVEPQGNLAPGGDLAQLADHVGRAAVDVQPVLEHQIERFGVEDIGRVNDRRRAARGRVTGGHRPLDFARAHRVDQHAVTPHEV